MNQYYVHYITSEGIKGSRLVRATGKDAAIKIWQQNHMQANMKFSRVEFYKKES